MIFACFASAVSGSLKKITRSGIANITTKTAVAGSTRPLIYRIMGHSQGHRKIRCLQCLVSKCFSVSWLLQTVNDIEYHSSLRTIPMPMAIATINTVFQVSYKRKICHCPSSDAATARLDDDILKAKYACRRDQIWWRRNHSREMMAPGFIFFARYNR